MKKRINKFITIFLSLMIILTFSIIVNSENIVTINMDNVKINRYSEKWNALNISDVKNLGSFTINLSWDPNIIDVIEINSNNFSIFPYISHNNGFVILTGYTIQGMNGSFELLDILFKAIGIANSSCYLKITDSEFLTADPKPNIINCNYNENLTLITITDSISNDNNTNSNTPYTFIIIIGIIFIVFIFIILFLFFKRKQKK